MLPLDSAEAEFRGWLESQPVPAWSSLADVPLGRRAKIARRLARQTDDVDERAELLAAACWPTGGAS